MTLLFTIIHVLVCLFLITTILLQAGKGHGLAGSSFGAEMDTVFGSKTNSFMTRLTTGCAVVFFITCIGINMLSSYQNRSIMDAAGTGVTQEQVDAMMEKINQLKEEQAALEEVGTEVAEEAQADAA